MTRPSDDRKTADSDQLSIGLLEAPMRVVNIGLQKFADDLAGQDVEVVQVDWAPPARGNAQLAKLLSRLMD
jgi:FdrA protein